MVVDDVVVDRLRHNSVICVLSKPPDQLWLMMSFYFIFDKLIKTQFNGFELVGENSIRDILFQEIRYQIRDLSNGEMH